MIRKLFVLLFVAVLVGACAAAALLFMPYRGFPDSVLVDIPAGTSTRGMAQKLQEAGVIRAAWQFLALRAIRSGTTLQAGEYQFTKPDSPWNIFERILRGDVFYYQLLVPEGGNQFTIAAELERMGLIPAKAFLAITADPALVKDFAPQAPSLEGYLFPAVYRITRHTSAPQIAREMVSRFKVAWKEAGGAPGMDVNRTVTLASLVEKESAVPAERPMIAGVFENRLRAGTTLDCDPTTIYAAMLENRYRGKIYRSDLDSPNLYNTYRHPGLPPGPIASPGVESIKAALHPAETEAIFFVAKPDGSGGHQFSSTLAEHNEAVSRYRSGQPK